MYPRILQPPSRSFFLFGARGTGKSTWLRATFLRHLSDVLAAGALFDTGGG